MSLGAKTKSVRSARKAPTATSRASHCSTSSCKTAVPVITRATTGAGFRWTRTLLPAAIGTASSQAHAVLTRDGLRGRERRGFAGLGGRHLASNTQGEWHVMSIDGWERMTEQSVRDERRWLGRDEDEVG